MFLFYSSGASRALHSFPTRRSSDLFGSVPDGRAEILLPSSSTNCSTFDLGSVMGVVLPVARSVATDRKSTRLNSSHLGISYAVFCLKKKKIDNTEHVKHS